MYEAEGMADESTITGRGPTVVAPAETPGLKGLLTLAVAVVVVAGLYLGRAVLIPITLAVLLSFLLAPIVNLLRRIHLGRVLSVIVAVLLALGIISALGGLIGAQFAGLAQDVPQYASTIRSKLESVQAFASTRMNFVIGRFGQQFEPPIAPKPKTTSPAEQKPMQVEVHQPDQTPFQLAERIITPIVDPLSPRPLY
jgi:predicted PurR-regulated permease PerM